MIDFLLGATFTLFGFIFLAVIISALIASMKDW
jgi:hypothetical protein